MCHMLEKPDIKEIVKNNPKVDLEKLKEGIKMLQKLRAAGVEIPKHRVVSAHARKQLRLSRHSVFVTDQNAS